MFIAEAQSELSYCESECSDKCAAGNVIPSARQRAVVTTSRQKPILEGHEAHRCNATID